MRNNKIFKDADSAFETVIENIESVHLLSQDEQTLAMQREVLQEPAAEMKTVYTSSALSKLHRLLATAKNGILTCMSNNQEFTKRFL
ncbi:Uncharacterized protein DBV15_07421 [Temnothorax longispinosus]|uniref:Uncharacterized protein n=1 Tax=Temnothorax longispinosus TaxID=300112 RepID=A0A4S2JNM3_9HYME|nr:Uncharacterized protein DBV15_07421 [Temnothorax longispinosus]